MPIVFFTPSQYNTEIVGEANYQKVIRKVAMYKELVDKDDMEDKMSNILAILLLEDDNKFDPGNAVRIEIENQTVGYLSKEDAQKYRKVINKLDLVNETCTCYATAYGKREALGKTMNYGIWLSIDLDNLIVGEKPRKKFLGLF